MKQTDRSLALLFVTLFGAQLRGALGAVVTPEASPRLGFLAAGHRLNSTLKVHQKASHQCRETGYGYEFRSRWGRWVLPPGAQGTTIERPCLFEGRSYRKGSLAFRCERSGWELAEVTCAESERISEPQCNGTRSQLALRSYNAEFFLPLANEGSEEERPCNTFKAANWKGTVKFECRGTDWTVTEHSCHSISGAGCLPTDYEVEMDGRVGTFRLPEGNAGAVEQRECVIAGERQEENATFRCADGVWNFDDTTCGSSSSEGSCIPATFKLTLDGNTREFCLPQRTAGAREEYSCNFDDEEYKKGSVIFKCVAGKWSFDKQTCTGRRSGACVRTQFAVSLGEHSGNFDLPAADSGTVKEMDCKFGDSALQGKMEFVCSDGEWAMRHQTCEVPSSSRDPLDVASLQ